MFKKLKHHIAAHKNPYTAVLVIVILVAGFFVLKGLGVTDMTSKLRGSLYDTTGAPVTSTSGSVSKAKAPVPLREKSPSPIPTRILAEKKAAPMPIVLKEGEISLLEIVLNAPDVIAKPL